MSKTYRLTRHARELHIRFHSSRTVIATHKRAAVRNIRPLEGRTKEY